MGKDCERGRVTHPATHLEVAQMSDGDGRFVDRTYVCQEHSWSKAQYQRAADGYGECHNVTRRRV